MAKKPVAMIDLFKMNEDDRIKYIADYCRTNGQVLFMVDMPTVPEGRGATMTKEECYLSKLKGQLTFKVLSRSENDPVPHVVTIVIQKLDE
jgi:hypothetical protein